MDENKKYCKGCGVLLQTTTPSAKGYILPKHFENGRCMRCFKIQQYSEFQVVDINNLELEQMILQFMTEKVNIIHVIDLADILGTALFELKKIFKNKPLILVVNKIDIIHRKSRRYDHWHDYITKVFQKNNLLVEQIFFVSAKEGLGIARLLDYLQIEANFKETKIIGSANVGKSSLLQAFFKEKQLPLEQTPTIFSTPGTTLNALSVSCDDLLFVDTPGIMKPQQLTYHVIPKMHKKIELLKPIRPINYPIYEPQTFFIGGYAQITIVPNKKTSVTFFCNQNLNIHRRKPLNAETFFQQHVGTLLAPPTIEEFKLCPNLLQLAKTQIIIPRPKTDIVISGLGWISFVDSEVEVEVITTKNVLVYQKPALV